MAWSKRGSWTWADMLYWIFYVPMTAALVVALITIPTAKLEAAVQPIPMDARIFEERVFQLVAKHSAVTGTDTRALTENVEHALRFSHSPKKFGYQIIIGDRVITDPRDFYGIARPLAPLRYTAFTAGRRLEYPPVIVTVNQVYPKQYETFR